MVRVCLLFYSPPAWYRPAVVVTVLFVETDHRDLAELHARPQQRCLLAIRSPWSTGGER